MVVGTVVVITVVGVVTTVVGVVTAVPLDSVALLVVDEATQLYPSAGPLCWQHVSQQTWPFTEQSAADRPVHQSAWSPYGQEDPSHGVSNAGQAKQHLDLTLEDCLHDDLVTFEHFSAEFVYSKSVESPNGQFSETAPLTMEH